MDKSCLPYILREKYMASISEILVQDDFGRIVSDLCVDTIENREPREYLEEYNGKRNRRTTSVGFREPKTVAVYSETEEELNTQTGKMEPKRLEDKTVPVAKIVTNIPKKIVRTAAAFLFGGDMTITADNTDDASLEDFKKIFVRKLKMKSVLMSFARKVLSETKAAIVFYPVNKVVNGKKVPELKAKILSLPKDDNVTYEFYPHFDDDDDMDAFIHKFTTKIDYSTYECVKIYTSDKVITAINKGGQWEIKSDNNLFGKIPVVYAEVDQPDWEDVALLMDHYEMRISRMSDTNDYFGDPMLKSFGLSNLPSKDTVGEELNFSMEVDPDTGTAYHGDAEYLSWQQSIDSQKEEISNERHEIFSGASCPDLSFDNLIGIGDLSGVSREFMTIDAKIKATLVRQMITAQIPVIVSTSGEFADGKKLEKAECVPEKVNILAEPSLVHSIVALHTKNVDLSQLRSDSTIDVELELPERVMCETKTVTVRFITED